MRKDPVLNWGRLGKTDYTAKVEQGVYTISVDSFQAGGAAYLWLPGQPDDDDYYMHFNNALEAMAGAERHYNMLLLEASA